MSNRVLSLAVLASVLMAASVVEAEVIAIKRDAGIIDAGNLDAVFSDAIADTSITVITGGMADAILRDGPTGTHPFRWRNWGLTTATVGGNPSVYQASLSSLPAGAIINKAEFRLDQGGGNAGTRDFGTIITQAWTEGNKNGDYPGAPTAATGATFNNPNGTNESTSGPMGWGTLGDSPFDVTVDGSAVIAFKALGSNLEDLVFDVTSVVQDWVDGTTPNYGFFSDTSSNYWSYLSEAATDQQPVLFIEYTAVVPEPAGLAVFGGLALMGLLGLRKRKR